MMRPRPLVAALIAVFTLGLAGGCAHEGAQGRAWVHKLKFEGNRALSSSTIKEKLATEQTGWWPFASKKWFDPAMLDVDLQRLPALYAYHGYFDAHVLGHDVKPRGDGSVDVIVKLDEGKPTPVEKVDVS